jgi:branched-chain amino acid aminotransferase
VIYLNGAIVPAGQARIDPFDRGFTLGDGLFETLRAYGGRPFRLADHLERMETAAKALAIPLPFDMPAVAAAIDELLRANGHDQGDAAVRITLSRGTGPRGLAPPEDPQPTLLISTAVYSALPDACSAVTVDIRRNEGSPLSRMKSLGALDNVLAAGRAAKGGADEAILANNAGFIACGARANLFALVGGRLVTPPIRDGALPGIARRVVLEIAATMGLAGQEISLRPVELERADEVWLTNSLFEVRSIMRLDGRTLQSRAVADKIRAEYRQMARLFNT